MSRVWGLGLLVLGYRHGLKMEHTCDGAVVEARSPVPYDLCSILNARRRYSVFDDNAAGPKNYGPDSPYLWLPEEASNDLPARLKWPEYPAKKETGDPVANNGASK